MKIKTSFPIEILVMDFIVGILSVGLSIYFLICKEYNLILYPGIFIVFFGALTFLIFLFSRLYIRIDNDNIEIRKYFKVRKYSLNKCDIIVKEINETVNGDLIYELTIKYENNKVLKVNSNSLDSEYRTKKYVSLLKTYKK
jgi:hypothetical protein